MHSITTPLQNQRRYWLVIMLMIIPLLHGCAAAIVGGAATGVMLVHDRRTAGTIIDDQNIEIKANDALESNAKLKQRAHISVISYNNVVLLTGEASNASIKALAEELVRPLPKVRRVYNELHVGKASTIESRSRDIFVTGKAKSALLQVRIQNFDPSRVKVKTERGIVYLMGLLTPTEAKAAVAQVRKVSGVRKVIKVFEYLPSSPS